MALFVDVDTLAGKVVVQGIIRRAVYEKGSLVIEGLSLVEAMAVLGALGTGTLAVAKLGGLLPTVPAVEAVQAPPQAPPPAPVAQAPAPAPSAPPVAPPSAPAAPPVVVAPAAVPVVTGPEVDREVARVDAGVAVDPAADPFTAPEVAPPAPAPSAPEAPAAEVYPTDVTRAQTLRPVVGWFGETKGIRDLAAMIEAVRALAPHCPLVAKIIATENDKLNARVEKTMTTLGYL